MSDLSTILLDWYDRNARDMPWRVSPKDRRSGILPNPYHVWMSEIMLQQTTVAAVKSYFTKFVTTWPTILDLAAAQDADVMAAWAGLGYYARARNLLKCARLVVAEHYGVFPSDLKTLLTLPGVGPYTAAAIASIAFDRAETVLDGNVERVMARLYDIHDPLPPVKAKLYERASSLTPSNRPGDYAQAVMDLGATICTPKSPVCSLCPWREPCLAYTRGTAPELPKKLPKATKPIRNGIAYVARRNDGAWLIETRPDKGLLGGMLGFPTSDWSADPSPAPPVEAAWSRLSEEARHTFTHFHLILRIEMALVDGQAMPSRGTFVSGRDFDPSALPTAMRKVFELALATQRNS